MAILGTTIWTLALYAMPSTIPPAMGNFGTPSVAIATTPTVVSTFFAHLFAKPSRRSAAKASAAAGGPGGGPEDDLTYEEGLKVVRRFIDFSSHRGVEEVQAFTSMQVPTPHWVRRKVVPIPQDIIGRAEEILAQHLGSYGPEGESGGGLALVGGRKWWTVRGRELEGEWIEMQKHYLKRKARQSAAAAATAAASQAATASSTSEPVSPVETVGGSSSRYSFLPHRSATMGSVKDNAGGEVIGDRVILYIHGGAFFFSSLDTHRYQIQRHARKAGARAFSPAYRLAPQYPFPCGLLDSLAAYLYLIQPPPNTHAPISPTSIIFMGDSAGGGMCISLLVLIREMGLPMPAGASLISPWVDLTHSMPSIGGPAGQDFIPQTGFHYRPSSSWPPLPGNGVKVMMPDGTERMYDEQVQMYCSNSLLTHPLVSPVNQGSLGGLCPLLILGGGGELLRDEIIYLAHKAANPKLYSPSARLLAQYPDQKALIDKYKPTKVHLQIHEGCCHVVPTLSWTRSAKFMYRACANFNIWAFTAAAKALIDKLENRRESHSSRRSRHSTHSGRHKHQHKHRDHAAQPSGTTTSAEHDVSRSSTLATSAGPSRSSTLDSAAPGATRRKDFAMTAVDGTPSDAPPQYDAATTSTPPSSQPDSALTSANPSVIDLTKPIISRSAAEAANLEDLDIDDLESECSSSSDEDASSAQETDRPPASASVTVSGTEPYPPPGEYIVSERVSLHGKIRPFEPIAQVPALDPALKDHIGQVHPDGAIQKWLAHRQEWDKKYAKELDKWRVIRAADRAKAIAEGFLTRDLHGEDPPLSALVGWHDPERARETGRSVDEIGKKTGGAVMLWMKMSSKADKEQAGGDSLAEIKKNVAEDMEEERQEIAESGPPPPGRRRVSVSVARDRRKSSVSRPSQAPAPAPAPAATQADQSTIEPR